MRLPAHIELRRSRMLAILLVLIHGIAGVCLVLMPWPRFVMALSLFAVITSGWTALRRSTPNGLRLAADGQLSCLIDSVDEPIVVEVLSDSTVFSQLIVLRLRGLDERGVRSLILFPDSISREKFRILRLWLRFCSISRDGVASGA